MASPTAFISYSWENEQHQAWVRDLADDLVENGVIVRLDQWHLQPGEDVAHFMQEAIDKADYLLLVCTPEYARKFDTRTGGVAHERDLILGEILTHERAEGRIIPLLRRGAASSALPKCLKSRLYVDFSKEDQYSSAFEQLIRHLHSAPKYKPPELGQPPSFLSESEAPIVAKAPPTTWVLVAGTGKRTGQLSEPDFGKLRRTSEALGQLLAKGNFGLVTGGWKGVDETVARSFAREVDARGLSLEDRLTQVITKTAKPAFAAGNLVLVKRGREEWSEAIRLVDAVVLIGGKGGAGKTGRMALDSGKAVFPLADTGGDAMELYMHMLTNWNDSYFDQIDRQRFQVVAREVPGVVEDLGSLLGMI